MRTPIVRSRHSLSLIAAAVLVASPLAARAAPVAWTGAVDLDWNNPNNWAGAVVPGSAAGQTAVFSTSPTGTVNVTASPANPIKGITVGNNPTATGFGTGNTANVAAINITGAALTLSGAPDLENPAGTPLNARTVFFARSGPSGNATAAYVIDNELVLNVSGAQSARFLLNGAPKSLTLNGVISNGALAVNGTNKGLAKDGDGTLTLTNAANSYVGPTEVIGGTLVLGGNAGTAGGVLGVNAGAVTLGTNNTGAAQDISLLAGGAFTVGRDIVLAANNPSTGVIAIGNTGSATGTSTFSGNVTLNKNVTLQSSGSAVADFTGTLSGVGNVTKGNSGTVRLSNANNAFSGTVTILNGNLSVASLGALGTNTAAITFGNAGSAVIGTLQYTGTSTTLDRDLVVQTQTTGGGNVDVTVAGQKLTIGTAARTVTGNGRFTFGGVGDVDVASALANTGNPVIKSGVGVGRLLNAGNTYTGLTVVRNGQLLIDAPGQLGASSGIALIDASALTPASPSFLTTTGFTVTQNVLVDDVAGSTGVSTVGAANTQTATSTTYSGSVTLNRPVRLTSDTAAGQAVTFSGQIVDGTGSFGLSKVGGGTVVLSNANNTYTGATLVNAGTLLVNGANVGGGSYAVDAGATLGGTGSIAGDVTVNGTLAPGASIESLDVVGSVTLLGTLAIEIAPAGAGSADLLAQSGTGETLSIDPSATLALSFAGAPDDAAYVIASYAALSGTFANVTGLPAGYELSYAYLGGNQIAVVSSVPEPTTFGAIALGLAALGGRRRRR